MKYMVGMAQLVSAPDCGSGGQGFESLYPPDEKHLLSGCFLFSGQRFGQKGRCHCQYSCCGIFDNILKCFCIAKM